MKWFKKHTVKDAALTVEEKQQHAQQNIQQQGDDSATENLSVVDAVSSLAARVEGADTTSTHNHRDAHIVTQARSQDTTSHANLEHLEKHKQLHSEKHNKNHLFSRLKHGLKKTTQSFSAGLGALFLGAKEIDEDLLEEIETQMIMADVGIEATNNIIQELTQKVARKELYDVASLYKSLQSALGNLLSQVEQPLNIATRAANSPYVILMVGVNGAGKTTTIGKLAKRFQNEGKKVMLAAGDTFRAAAVEQLQVWGERNDVPVIAQTTGSDSASVIYDALDAAISRNVDVLIADTAGRLHSQNNLMEELKKIVRVMKKRDSTAPHEVMLIIDASTGQNAIAQAKHFQQAVGVTGITVTKLDGTAKGGVIFSISQQLQLPIRFIGVGETVDDLRPFVATDFVQALFDQETS